MQEIVKKICLIADRLAGICFFAVMTLVVVNIIMRKVFTMSIMGAYELVGLLTAAGVGLALAQCALNDGHIAVSILTDRLSKAGQEIVSIAIHVISLVFWLLICWRMFVFGSTTFSRGMVSSTAQFPVYPFMFIIAFGLFCLCLVLALKLTRSCSTALRKENK